MVLIPKQDYLDMPAKHLVSSSFLKKDEHNLWIILQLINFLSNNIKVQSSSVIFTYKYCIAIVDDKEIFAY